MQQARRSERDFTRERALPLQRLVPLLLNFRKGTNRDELEQFFETITDDPTSVTPVSEAAFCRARQKLKPEALVTLNNVLLDSANQQIAQQRWRGLRVLAVDGSTGRLPDFLAIEEYFGKPSGSGVPLARFSRLFDVLNDQILHADMVPYATGERELAAEYLKRVFDLVKDFGTSESPKSTRSSTTHWCPGRPGHPAFRHNIASSLRLHTGLPYDWTPRSDAPLGSPLAPSARRVSRVASRLPGTTRLRFALHGGQRLYSSPDDLFLYDRGYPAFWLFAFHAQEQRHYCARVRHDFHSEVKAFVADGAKERIVVLTPNTASARQCREGHLPADPLRVRLIRVELESGEVEVLITSLLDTKAYPYRAFAKLYALRWGIEENYKREKQRLEIENFSGRSPWVLLQDFHAKIFAQNLTAIFVRLAQWLADARYQHRRHGYRINFANALSKMKNNLVRLFLETSPLDLSWRLLQRMADAVVAVRPGRKFPRDMKKVRVPGFQMQYRRTR